MDAVSLDATHSFIAGKCGLVPVVTEYYGKTLFAFFFFYAINHDILLRIANEYNNTNAINTQYHDTIRFFKINF